MADRYSGAGEDNYADHDKPKGHCEEHKRSDRAVINFLFHRSDPSALTLSKLPND